MTTILNPLDIGSLNPEQANVPQQTEYLKGNHPFLLDHPDRCWFVRSGSINVFKVAVVNGEPVGSRHFLFSVSTGELLLGTPLDREQTVETKPKSSESQNTEPKSPEQPRSAELRSPEQPRSAEPKSPEPRITESKSAELRNPEPRITESKSAELRNPEPRSPELKSAELRNPEPRSPEPVSRDLNGDLSNLMDGLVGDRTPSDAPDPAPQPDNLSHLMDGLVGDRTPSDAPDPAPQPGNLSHLMDGLVGDRTQPDAPDPTPQSDAPDSTPQLSNLMDGLVGDRTPSDAPDPAPQPDNLSHLMDGLVGDRTQPDDHAPTPQSDTPDSIPDSTSQLSNLMDGLVGDRPQSDDHAPTPQSDTPDSIPDSTPQPSNLMDRLISARPQADAPDSTPQADAPDSTPQPAIPQQSDPSETYYCAMAVAIEETELLTLPMTTLARQVRSGAEDFTRCLETWLHHWTDALQAVDDPSLRIQSQGRQSLTLTEGQSFQPLTPDLAWVRIDTGSALWMGQDEFVLTEQSRSQQTLLPFCDRLWLGATSTLEITLLATPQLTEDALVLQGLEQFHRYALRCLNRIEKYQTDQAFEQFQQRHLLNRQVTQAALDDLASILQPPDEIIPAVEGDPLLVAAGAVGRAMGITINPPARSEELSRVKDPLEAIARASQFRMRNVLLTDGWWKQNNGPLLAYTEDHLPVALLPTDKGRYEIFNPVTHRRGAVNEAIVATIAPEAFMFYRPLVGKIKQPLDLLVFSLKGYEWDLVWLVLTGLIATLLGMMIPQATAILIDSAIPDSDVSLLWQVGMMLFAVAIGQSAFQLSRGLISLKIETAADATLQPAVWDNLLSLKPSFFRTYSSGDVQSRVLSIGSIRRQISGTTLRTIFSSVFALLNLGLMFAYSPALAIIACGITVIAIAVTLSSSLLTLKSIRPMQKMDGVLLGLTVQLINGVAKLRVAAAEERAFAHWGRTYSKQQKLMVRAQRIDDSVTVFNELLPTISAVLLFWFAVQIQQSQGGAVLSAGMFLAFNSAFGIFIGGATDLSNTLINILNIIPLWERAQSIIKAEPEVDPSQTDPGRLTGRLALDHVTFRYRDDGPLILDDVTIEAEPGEFIAFVGPSGSGKSTVFRLLLGFETPASGTVYYDGQDLAGSNVNAIRRQLGVVLQNGRISTGSIFEIITGGALVTMDEAWEAARNAGFAQDIQQMPMGMHTVISEGGSNLSGGQRQRLLIARSLVLKPKIILMDEATSALDNNTQSIITDSLSRMNATRVVIAHRLSTIRDADRIYVLANGRVEQAGTFDELVQQEGLFARLAARQLE